MNKYNILQAIPMSFYSKNLYRDVAHNWGGKAFLYLLFLIALSWIVFTIELQIALTKGYEKVSDKVAAQVPVMTIKDGKISTPEKRPYFITSPDTHENIAVIDTTGKYKTLEEANTSVLVTETSVISQSKPNEIRTDIIPSTLNMVVNPESVKVFISKYLHYAWIILFIFFVILAYIYRIIQALIYAIIGRIFGAIAGVPISYGQIILIALVSITPVIVVATILDVFLITFPYQMLFYFVLAMAYLFYGIMANKSIEEQK